MKAIQINATVNLNNGLQIPSGSVAVISEGLAQVFATKDGVIPAMVFYRGQLRYGYYSDLWNY